MSNVNELLNLFAEVGVSLNLTEKGDLKLRGNTAGLSKEHIVQVKLHKADIVAWVKQQTEVKTLPALVKLPRDAEHYGLSFAQQRLWFLDQLQRGSAEFNMAIALEIRGNFDVSMAELAISQIIARHEILRTVYRESEAGSVQVIQPVPEFRFTHRDLTKLSELDATRMVKMLMIDEVRRSFTLSKDLMLRGTLVSLANKANKARYVLLFTMHHIASDGWSMGVLINEFVSLYTASDTSLENVLPPLPVQYIDYAKWQRDYLSGEQLNVQLNYWKNQLQDLPVQHGLMLDHARPKIKAHVGGLHSSKHSERLMEDLSSLARDHGMTLFMVLQAAFALLVSRHSFSQDIVMGIPVANRRKAELNPLIGFFINTLVLRTNTAHDNLGLYLEHVHKTHLDAQNNQDVPFEQIVELCDVSRNTAHTPLFQIMFTMDTTEQGELALPDIEMTVLAPEMVSSKFDIELSAHETPKGLELSWLYDAGLFEAEHIVQLDVHLGRLLASLAAVQNVYETSLTALNMLSDTETAYLTIGLNDTYIAYPEGVFLHKLFEQQTAKNPHNIALVFEGKTLSYEKLNQKSNQLAHYLKQEHKVVSDTLVGLCIERSLEMVIAIVAIHKAGGAYVPLDPSYPIERLGYMLEDADLALVLSNSASEACLREYQGHCVLLDGLGGDSSMFSDYSQANISEDQLTTANIAYVIYTSGSTGQPKGVMVPHAGLINRILWMQDTYGSGPDSIFLQKTPFSFDVSVWEFVWPLATGARLAIAEPGGHKDPHYLAELIQSEGITKLHFVPSMLSSMLASGCLSQCRSLEQVFCSGEALTLEQVIGLKSALPECELHNLYGPTEASIDVSFWDCSQVKADSMTSIPIGRPIANMQLYVLDADLQLSPPGVPGEIHISGIGLARGYLNRPELTLEKFIPNPFAGPDSGEHSQRLYKTGDLARWLPCGELEYLGRIDHQVKIRGLRIELGEIEHALLSIDGVSETVVVAHCFSKGDVRLVAYLVCDAEDAVAEWSLEQVEDIKQQLKEKIPEFMIPSRILRLESLPLSENGKIDRKNLPKPEFNVKTSNFETPDTETEQTLAQVWADLLELNVEKISRLANFFQLGGHSLLIMKLLTKLQDKGWQVEVQTLFHAENLQTLAQYLDQNTVSQRLDCEGSHAEQVSQFVVPENAIPEGCKDIQPEMLTLVVLNKSHIEEIEKRISGGSQNIEDIYPLSTMQEGMLFHHIIAQNSDPYISPYLFRIADANILSVFLSALEDMLTLHEVLRTAVLWENLPEPVQVVCRKASLPIEHLSFAPEKDLLAEMQALCAADKQWMDLGTAPLLRVKVAQDVNNSYLLVLQIHHLVDDITSLQILREQIAARLNPDFMQQELISGNKNKDTRPKYRDFVAQSRYQVSTSNAATYFAKELGDYAQPCLMYDIHEVQGEGGNVQELIEDLSLELSDDVREIARSITSSPASVFHAIWTLVVSACSGKQDVIFGSVFSGRLQGLNESESMLGMFVNTLPVRMSLENKSVRQLFVEMRTRLRTLVKYEQVPLSVAHGCSGVPNEQPLFNALMNYRHAGRGKVSEEDFKGIELLESHERTNYPVTLSVDDLGEQFRFTLQISDQINGDAIIEYLQTAARQLIHAMKHEPERLATSVNVLPDSEVNYLVNQLSLSEAKIEENSPLNEHFERQGGFGVGGHGQKISFYVLDKSQKLLPTGVAGELYVAGAGLSRENLVDSKLSGHDLVQISCIKTPQSNENLKLYRTGLKVRWLSDGSLSFIGKIENRVSVTGSETGEADNPPLGQFDFGEASVASQRATARNYVAPENEIEHSLVAIWSGLLHIDAANVSTSASFFELGGHSLLAVRLAGEIQCQFKVELKVREIFETTCLRELGDKILQAETKKLLPEITRITNEFDIGKSDVGSKGFSLSYSQQRLWFIDQLQKGTPEYNVPMAFEFTGRFDLKLAEQALTEIIRRHAVLRTIYQDTDAGNVQIIRPATEFTFQYSDLTGLSTEECETTVKRMLSADVREAFDLSRDLMLRGSCLALPAVADENRYVVLLTMHHIASDGWSMGVLVNEFVTLYTSLFEGEIQQISNILPPLPLQYVDYAQWQRSYLTGEQLTSQLNYWRQQLQGIPAQHNLKLDMPRPAIKGHSGALYISRNNHIVQSQLQKLAKNNNLTMYMVVHAAFALLLSRHSNSQDIVMGTPVANRRQVEINDLIGFFVNTLVLRSNTAHDNLKSYLAHIRQINLDAQSHQDAPFEKVVEQCDVPRSSAFTPLFQILLSMDTNEQRELWLPDVKIAGLSSDTVISKFDLELHARETADGLAFSWLYDCELFNEQTIVRLDSHLIRLLQSMASAADDAANQSISTMAMLADEEVNLLTSELNNTQVDYPKGICLQEAFESAVRMTPDHIAVAYEGQKLSFDELNRQANKMSRYILSHYGYQTGKTFAAGTSVAVIMDNGLDLIVAMLAILKAGGAYIPLPSTLPFERINYIINDADVGLIITQEALKPLWEGFVNDRLCIMAEQSEKWQHLEADDSGKPQSDTQMAYVIYTSGTTGSPKGVVVQHCGVMDYLQSAHEKYFSDTSEKRLDGTFLTTSFGFDISVPAIWLPLLYGKTLTLPANSHEVDSLARVLVEDDNGFLLRMTPNHAENLMSLLPDGFQAQQKHTFVLGGSILSLAVANKLQTLFPASQLYNHYGPTEAIVGCAMFDVSTNLAEEKYSLSRGATAKENNTIPIGRPMNNVSLYVLSEDLALVPFGANGELCVGGEGLAMGYLNQKKLTIEKFVVNPYGPGLLYKTGDTVRYRQDGNLEYLGRKDNQVKIRGHRIELSDISFQLNSISSVGNSYVMPEKQYSKGMQLIAYVVPAKRLLNERDWISNIKAILKERLPEYMIPRFFHIIDALPLNANGKIDEKSLMEFDSAEFYIPYEAPTSNLERKITGIWSQILGIPSENISINASFFQLGGHSINILFLLKECQKQGLGNITLQDIYEEKSVKELAEIVLNASSAEEISCIVKLNQGPEQRNVFIVHPLFGQVQCYKELANQLEGSIQVYGIQSPALMGIEFRFSSIKELAQYYLNQIRKIQPYGPYRLAGWSAGGLIVAYIAHLLSERGEVIDNLLIIDTETPEEIALGSYEEALILSRNALLFNCQPNDLYAATDTLITSDFSIEEKITGMSELLKRSELSFLGDTVDNQVYLKACLDFFRAEKTELCINSSRCTKIILSEEREDKDLNHALWPTKILGSIEWKHLPFHHEKLMEDQALQIIVQLMSNDVINTTVG